MDDRLNLGTLLDGLRGAPRYNETRRPRPTFVCLKEGVPELERVLEARRQGIEPVAFAQDAGPNTAIYLCPAFFNILPTLPTKGVNCPTVNVTVDPTKYVK